MARESSDEGAHMQATFSSESKSASPLDASRGKKESDVPSGTVGAEDHPAEDTPNPHTDSELSGESSADDEENGKSDDEAAESEFEEEDDMSEDEGNNKYIAPILDGREITFKMRILHPHIVCSLCSGYMMDATTITECMHSFCRSCILKYIQQSDDCPKCGVHFGPNPIESLRQDHTLQSFIYKVLPWLQPYEEALRSAFYATSRIDRVQDEENVNKFRRLSSVANAPSMTDPAADGYDHKSSFSSARPSTIENDQNDDITFLLELNQGDESSGSLSDSKPLKALEKPFIKVSGRTTVLHLKKYLCFKLALTLPSDVDILCNGEILGNELSLEFVRKSRWNTEVAPCMILGYRSVVDF